MKKKLANGETVPVWIYPERFSDRGRFRRGNGEIVPIETQVTKIGTSYMTVISGDRFHLSTQKDENGNPYHLHHNGQYSPEYRAYTTKEAAMDWAERERDLVKLRDIVQRLNDLTGLQIKLMLHVATNALLSDEQPRDWEKPPEEVVYDCFICGGKGTMKGSRTKTNGHFRGKCTKCGARIIE